MQLSKSRSLFPFTERQTIRFPVFGLQFPSGLPSLAAPATFFTSGNPVIPVGLVGLTGFEPVTLRLSSACSNQLSYRPALKTVQAGGAEETRTPDILLAKQTLYHLSYSPLPVKTESYDKSLYIT